MRTRAYFFALVLVFACKDKDQDSKSLREKELEVELAQAKAALAQAEAEKARAQARAPEPQSAQAAGAGRECSQARVIAHDAWEKAEKTQRTTLGTARAKAQAAGKALAAKSDRMNEEIRNGADMDDASARFRTSAENRNYTKAVAELESSEAALKLILDAKKASGDGALKFRDAARAVRDNPSNPGVADAKRTTEAAFEACKVIAP